MREGNAQGVEERLREEPGPFEQLIREFQSMVFSLVYGCLHDRESAEEIAQDVFLQLDRNLGEMDSKAHVRHWLCKVAAHRAIDHARRRKAWASVPLNHAPEPVSPEENRDPLLGSLLRQLVASLPPKPRMVMVLRYQEDLDPAEIAEILNMPLSTVKSHLQRSLVLLREKVARRCGKVSL
jgi:RNA polymerase sigma-70 factor (ECF subfamily)